MNLRCLRRIIFILTLLAFAGRAAAAPDIPWPSAEVLGELHQQVTELHSQKLISDSLKEKYVQGDSSFMDIVYDHQYISVDKDGRQISYSDSAIRANTPQSTQALGEYTVRFNAAKESVDILLAEVYLPNGKKIQTDTSLCQVKEPFTSLVYSDLKVKTLSLKGIEEGAVLRVVVRRTYKPDVDKGFALLNYTLEVPVPMKEFLVVLRVEPDARIVRREKILNPSPAIFRKVYTTDKGETYYTYGISGIKPKIPESASIPSFEVNNRVLFASQSTWSDVARWWSGLYEPKVSSGPAIREKAAALTGNLPDRESKIRALFEYVKSIRYVSIVLNEGAYVPHPAEETLKNKYGDCKDKAVLLLSLLRSIGIDGVVALVRVESLVDTELPSPKYFDHAIVALPGPDQTYTFLDATGAFTPYGMLPGTIQYRHALVPRGDTGELVLIPPQPPDMNRVEEAIEADVQDPRIATITSRSSTYSANAWYHVLPTIPKPLLQKAIEEMMAKKYKDFQIISFRVDPADDQGVLKAETKYKVGDFTKRMGNVYIFNPLFDADKLGDESIVGPSERKSDIELDGPKKLSVTATIRLPESITIEALPKPLNIRNDKFGSYSYEVSQSPGTLRIRREVLITAKRVAAKDYAEFRRFYRACLNQDEELVGIKAAEK